MSMLNLHFHKIVRGYIDYFIPTKTTIKFIKKPSSWFFRKNDNCIIFNTYIIDKVKEIYPKEAIYFFDCLIICSLHYLKEIETLEVIDVEYKDALDTLRAPFYNNYIKQFLALYLAYTPKENYRNLEIADDLESNFT